MRLKSLFIASAMGLILVGAGCADFISQRPDLGFTVEDSQDFGAWQIAADVNNPQGSFENGGIMTYRAIKPNTGDTGKGATYANIVGYRKAVDGTYEYTFNGLNWSAFDEDNIRVLGETPLKNSQALLLGPTDCKASPACYGPTGPWMAIINTPNGVTPGGVFTSGETTIIEAFKAVLATVTVE